MAARDSCTPSSRAGGHDCVMDVVAVILGIAMFAVLYLLVFGIDRI